MIHRLTHHARSRLAVSCRDPIFARLHTTWRLQPSLRRSRLRPPLPDFALPLSTAPCRQV